MMIRFLTLLLLTIAAFGAEPNAKLRVLVLTDIENEPDDQQQHRHADRTRL